MENRSNDDEIIEVEEESEDPKNNRGSFKNTGFPKATTVEESPLSFLSKELTEPGTSKRSGSAPNFTFSSTNTGTTDDVDATKGPFSVLKGFANTTAAAKPFSTSLSGGAAGTTFRQTSCDTSTSSAAATINLPKFTVESFGTSSFISADKEKVFMLNNEIGFPKATTVGESPLSFLSKELTEPETSKRSGSASNFTFSSTNTGPTGDVGASKGPFSGLKGFANTTDAAKPFSTSSNGGAAGTTFPEKFCNTSTSSAAATINLPKFTVGSFGTSAFISADKAKVLMFNDEKGFPKATTVGESPLSFLSKELTEPGTSTRSGSASNFTFSSTNTGPTNDVGASKGPFSGLKGFANTTVADKCSFSFLSRTSNASGDKQNFTFSSPNTTAEAEYEKSNSYVTKQKKLNQTLTEGLRTPIAENPVRDLTPPFHHYVNYLKGEDKDDDKLEKSVSGGAEKVPLMATPFYEFRIPAKPFFTSISGGAAANTSAQTSAHITPSRSTSTSSAAATITLPKFSLGSFSTSALISADKARIFGGTTKSFEQETKTSDFNFALKSDQNNTTTDPNCGNAKSSFFGSNEEEKSSYNHMLFGGNIPSNDNNKESENKPPAPSFTPDSAFLAFMNTKSPALSVIPEESGEKSCNSSRSLTKFTVGSFGTSALISADKARLLEGAITSSTQATETNAARFGSKLVEKNWITDPSSRTESCFFGGKVEEKSSSTPPTFSDNIPSTANNKKSEENPPDLSFTPGSAPFTLMNLKSTALTSSPEKCDDDMKECKQKNAVYSKMCKVFIKIDGKYADHGVGMLYLKPIKVSGKTQLLVRAATELGNVLVNLVMTKELLMQRMGEHNVLMVAASSPTIPIILRFKTREEADELLATLEKYTK